MTTDPKPRNLADPFVIFSDPREGDRFKYDGAERIIDASLRVRGGYIDNPDFLQDKQPIWYKDKREVTNIRPVPNPESAKANLTCAYCKKRIDLDTCWCGESEESHTQSTGHVFTPMGCDCKRTPSREDSSAVILTSEPAGVEAERPPAVRVFRYDTFVRVFGRGKPEYWSGDRQNNPNTNWSDLPQFLEDFPGSQELLPAEAEKWCEEHPTPGAEAPVVLVRTTIPQSKSVMYGIPETNSEAASIDFTPPIPSPDSPGKSNPNAEKESQPSDLFRLVASRINSQMIVKKISRADLAAKLGVTRPYITQLLRGTTNMTLGKMEELASAIGLRVVDLVTPPYLPTTPTQEKPCSSESSLALESASSSPSESLSGSTKISSADAPADDAWAMEKRRRVYYQDIVYTVCNLIDNTIGDGSKVVCGTLDSPSDGVQVVLKRLFDEHKKERQRSVDDEFHLVQQLATSRDERDDARRKAADASKELAEAHRVIAEYAGRMAAGDIDIARELDAARENISKHKQFIHAGIFEALNAPEDFASEEAAIGWCKNLATRVKELEESQATNLKIKQNLANEIREWYNKWAEEHDALNELIRANETLAHQRDQLAAENACLRSAIVQVAVATGYQGTITNPAPSLLVTDFLNCWEGIEFLRSFGIKWAMFVRKVDGTGDMSNQVKLFGIESDALIAATGYVSDPLAAILAGKGKV